MYSYFSRGWMLAALAGCTGAVSACASELDQHRAASAPAPAPVASVANDPDLSVSVSEVGELSSANVGVLSFSLANQDETFLHIDDVLLTFGAGAETQPVSILEGEELRSWARAVAIRNQSRQLNRESALAVMAMLGDLAAVANRPAHRPWLLRAAFTPLLASNAVNQAEGCGDGGAMPPSQLTASPFALTPKLEDKRWVALATEDPRLGCIDFVTLRMHSKERGWHQFSTRFRTADDESEWQSATCHPKRPGFDELR
jgi:hypothetical protein